MNFGIPSVFHTTRATVAVLLLGMLAACGNQPTGDNPTAMPAAGTEQNVSRGKIKVVATFSILGDLVQNVGGDRIELRTLVPAGGDAHTFEPSPTDSVALVDAAVIFENGLEFESWLPDLYAASQSKATRVVVTDGIDSLTIAEEQGAEHDQHANEAGHGHGEHDPHTWHDVNNVVVMVEHIRDGLAKADPADAATYQSNAASYLSQLKQLDAYVVSEVAKLPAERRKLVTTHDTFAYFARRYGFEIVGTTLGSVSTEVADPSAADLVTLVNQIKATGVPAIFAENVSSGSLTERVANEAGVKLGPLLYTDALGEPGSNGDTYLKMIRYNIDAIVTALSA